MSPGRTRLGREAGGALTGPPYEPRTLKVNVVLQCRDTASKETSVLMRPSPALIDRFTSTLVKRLATAEFVELLVPEDKLRAQVARVLNDNFAAEAVLEADARAQAEKLIRQGAPGVPREELDLRKVELLVKQRLAKERGFVL